MPLHAILALVLFILYMVVYWLHNQARGNGLLRKIYYNLLLIHYR